jgi:hypothetical protein
MRNHTLMQTIARANRVFPEKDNGLIVDYVGVFRNLEKALAGSDIIRDKSELVSELETALGELVDFSDRWDQDGNLASWCWRIWLVSPRRLPPFLLRFTQFAKRNQSAMPLVSVGWRTGVLVCAILLSAATKWPLHFFYCFCVLGCYFPFLLLESALSIIKVQQDSRP